MKGYDTITTPPPFGSGNFNLLNRPAIQLSTAVDPIEEDLIPAFETDPSPAIVNLTIIFPFKVGFLVSSLW
jgi:hypothetical protein